MDEFVAMHRVVESYGAVPPRWFNQTKETLGLICFRATYLLYYSQLLIIQS